MNSVQFTEPTVKHTTVSVQNVFIGKRQLTQRVFKQIQHERLIDKEGNLRGEPWGYVNYFWENVADETKHILWVTLKGELRRFYYSPHEYTIAWEKKYDIHERIPRSDYQLLPKYNDVCEYMSNLPQLYIAV